MAFPYWRLSGFYFAYFVTLGAFVPYWNVYLAHLGFDAVQIGKISAVLVLTRIVAPNLWGWIADRSGKSLLLIRLTLICATLAFSGFLRVEGFVQIALCTVGFGLFWNATLPLFEAVTLAHLGNDAHRYSQIRLWGSVGFIAAVGGLGFGFDHLSILWLPFFILLALALNGFLSLRLPSTAISRRHGSHLRSSGTVRRGEIISFLLVSMLLQASHGPYYVFFSLYLNQLQYAPSLIGGMWALGVLAEIALFLKIRPLLSRFSLRAITLASLLLAVVRWLLIGFYADLVWVLIIAQVLHAASFGSAHIAAIHLVQRYFGEKHQSTGQALYSSFSFGFGGLFGSLFSGYFWLELGPSKVFSLAALIALAALVIAWFGIQCNDGETYAARLK